MKVNGTFARAALRMLGASILLTACSEPKNVTSPVVTAVKETAAGVSQLRVTKDQLTMEAGEVARVELAKGQRMPSKPVWTSDDASIAAVSAEGVVTARSAGSTTVTVSIGDQSTDVLVTIYPKSKSARSGGQAQ